jgi:hypothetical protein
MQGLCSTCAATRPLVQVGPDPRGGHPSHWFRRWALIPGVVTAALIYAQPTGDAGAAAMLSPVHKTCAATRPLVQVGPDPRGGHPSHWFRRWALIPGVVTAALYLVWRA